MSVKNELAAALQAMAAAGISPGASGNASARDNVNGQPGMWISASGIAAADTTPDNLVFVAEGQLPSASGLKASSEWQLHQHIYADHPRAQAIVHCHSRYATAIACQRRVIPAVHYMVAIAGGSDIPCAAYAEFGTEALARAVSACLQERDATLMANHGQLAIADTPAQALAICREVEELAAIYQLCLQTGNFTILSDEEMQAVLTRFASGYGQAKPL